MKRDQQNHSIGFAAAVAALSLWIPVSGYAQAQGQAPEAAKKPGWETSAAVGLTVTKGNSDTVTGTGNVIAQKKWERAELRLGADVTYGENEGVKSAESYHAFGQYNKLLNERVYGYFRADGLHDDIADVQYRITVGPGAGYYFIKKARTQLSGEAGPSVVFERQGVGETTYFTLRVAERFEHKFNDKTRLWQSVEWLPQVDDFNNSIINGELGVETQLTEKFSLRLFAQDTYDNEPAPGRKRNDLKLVAQLACKFL